MTYFIRFALVVLSITICYAWYDKHVALPHMGEYVTICGLHSETLYRQTGDDMTGGEPPPGYMNDNMVLIRIESSGILYEFVTNDQAFYDSLSVGDTLIAIFNQAGGISNIFKR